MQRPGGAGVFSVSRNLNFKESVCLEQIIHKKSPTFYVYLKWKKANLNIKYFIVIRYIQVTIKSCKNVEWYETHI